MSAQIDWDRSGISLQSTRVNLGPSLGWVDVAGATLTITSAGTFAIPFGISLVNVNVAGSVTIDLPSAKASAAGAMAQPNSFALVPIVVADIGGFAAANPITINAAPGETIVSVASIVIGAAFGAVTLQPDINTALWSIIST